MILYILYFHRLNINIFLIYIYNILKILIQNKDSREYNMINKWLETIVIKYKIIGISIEVIIIFVKFKAVY